MATLMRNLIGSEPLLKNRFVVTFLNAGLDIPSWLVQSTSMPKIKVNAVEVPYFNTSQFVQGRYQWEPIDITFISPIGPSSNQKLMEFLRTQLESYTGRQSYAIGYKTDIAITQTDGIGTDVTKFICYNCQITNLSFDDMSYEDDKFQQIKLTIQPDYCEQLF